MIYLNLVNLLTVTSFVIVCAKNAMAINHELSWACETLNFTNFCGDSCEICTGEGACSNFQSAHVFLMLLTWF